MLERPDDPLKALRGLRTQGSRLANTSAGPEAALSGRPMEAAEDVSQAEAPYSNLLRLMHLSARRVPWD